MYLVVYLTQEEEAEIGDISQLNHFVGYQPISLYHWSKSGPFGRDLRTSSQRLIRNGTPRHKPFAGPHNVYFHLSV